MEIEMIIARLALGFVVSIAVTSTGAIARAESCSGNPDALGTSRVLTLVPTDYPKVGAMAHAVRLPLAEKEVVLTFDDGPIPRYSNQVLDILAAQCTKATFFLVGEMAHEHPATVHPIFAEGHTIGTHSEDHPLRFGKLSRDLVEWEIDKGIIDVVSRSVGAARLRPLFRVPGLGYSDMIDGGLAASPLVSFSPDRTRRLASWNMLEEDCRASDEPA